MQRCLSVLFLLISFTATSFAQSLEIIGSYPSEGTIYDMEVRENYVFLASGYAGLEIIDINDPENPTRIGQYTEERYIYSLAVKNDYAYLYSREFPISLKISIINIADYANPLFANEYILQNGIGHMQVMNSLLFCSSGEYGLYVFNISSPENPLLWGHYPGLQEYPNVLYLFTQSPYCFMHCSSDYYGGGLKVMNFTNPLDPAIVCQFDTRTIGAIQLIDSIGYLCTGDNSVYLDIYNFSNPSEPVLLGRYSHSYGEDHLFPHDLCVIRNYCYVNFGWDGGYTSYIQIFDVGDFNNPELVGNYFADDDIRDIDSFNGNLVVASGSNLLILNPVNTDIERTDPKPEQHSLLSNYPNPFNAQTTISYHLPNQAAVSLEIYDILGQKVQTLVDEVQQSGSYDIVWNASGVSSGVYFARLRTEGNINTTKLVLLK